LNRKVLILNHFVLVTDEDDMLDVGSFEDHQGSSSRSNGQPPVATSRPTRSSRPQLRTYGNMVPDRRIGRQYPSQDINLDYSSLGIVSLPLKVETNAESQQVKISYSLLEKSYSEEIDEMTWSDNEDFFHGGTPKAEKESIRRSELANNFQALQDLLPKLQGGSQATKIKILQEAKDYCDKLSVAEKGLINLKALLKRKKIQLTKRKDNIGQQLLDMKKIK
jgi:hypothetical protein